MAAKMKNPAQSWYATARCFLIAEVILTAVKCITYLAQIKGHYLFSVYSAYTMFEPTPARVCTTAAILIPFVLAFILSKKKPGWMVAALVMQIFDTLFLLLAFAGKVLASDIETAAGKCGPEIIFHIIILVVLIFAVKNRSEAVQAMNAPESPEETSESEPAPEKETEAQQ